MDTDHIFKTCPSCSKSWATREDFLSDGLVELNGYQVSMRSLEKGLFLFTHMSDNCHSTMGIYVSEFSDLFTGTRYSENKALSAECPRYCEDEKRLDRCSAKCECAYIREILHIINIQGYSLPHHSS